MPLRFLRPALVPAALSLAAICVVFGNAPTFADQARSQEWWLRALHVPQAWEITQGAGVTVAVLDTGVDPRQPDLTGSVLTGSDFTHSGETPATPFFAVHGTAVASLIAGHGHGGSARGAGVIGIAPAARILSVRVTLDQADPLLANAQTAAALPDAIAAGIRYAARQGAKVIDLPLDPQSATVPAGSQSPATPAAHGSAAEQSAIAYALSQGVVLVAQAGDDGTSGNAVNYPAAYPGVISVGAFNQTFIKAPFSIRQPYVKLTAPGDGVMAATLPQGYAAMHSTSAASAIVAGIAALVRAQYPQLSPSQVTQALENGTVFRPNGKTGVGSGFGTADAAKALKAAAAVAGPGATRSGSGAVPRVQPSPPPIPPLRQSTASRLTRNGLISGAVLIVLLLPIGLLALVRRRAGRRPAAGPDLRGRPGYAATAAGRGEPRLRYLAAPAARLAEAGGSHAAGTRRPLAARTGAASGSDTSRRAQAFPGDSMAAGRTGAREPGSAVFSMPTLGAARAAGPDALAARRAPDTTGGFSGFTDTGWGSSGPHSGLGTHGSAAAGRTDAPSGAHSGAVGSGTHSSPDGLGGPSGSGSQDGPGEPGQHGGAGGLDGAGTGGFSGSSSFTGISARAPSPAPPRPSAAGQVPPVPLLAPVNRPPTSRAQKVSGSPPWEPAAKPDSELPWANVPPPQPASGPAPQPGNGHDALPRRPVPRSVWDTGHGAEEQAGARPGGAADSEPQIFLWNPGATTETFPALPERRPTNDDSG